MTDLHTCSYSCDRPMCIKAQRDELRAVMLNSIRDEERLRDAARIALTAEADAVVDKLRAERRGMTRIYYWCPMYRAYVYAVVPTQVAFTLMGWV